MATIRVCVRLPRRGESILLAVAVGRLSRAEQLGPDW
jgi:hypothetical protein